MTDCICPYIKYILNSIDDSYKEENPDLDEDIEFQIYPLGSFYIHSIEDLCTLTNYILNRIFTNRIQFYTLNTYSSKLSRSKNSSIYCNTFFGSDSPYFSSITDGSTLFRAIHLFFINIDNFIRKKGIEKNKFIEDTFSFFRTLGRKERDYDNIFTIFWNILISLDSIVENDFNEQSSISDSNQIQIKTIIENHFTFFPHTYNPEKKQQTSPLVDINEIKNIDKFNFDYAPYNITINYEHSYLLGKYFNSLLLITHYFAKYNKIIK